MLDFGPVLAQWPRLVEGARTTIMLSAAAMVLGAIAGSLLCGMRLSRAAPLRIFAMIFISIFRGLPLLVILLSLFYVPSALGIEMAPLTAALLGMVFNTAAYQAEIYRAGYSTVPYSHTEAARMLGFTRLQTVRHVLMPQILRNTVPALVNESIDVMKSSGLVSIIAVTELLRIGQQIVSLTYRPLEVYLCCGAIYLLLSLGLAQIGRRLEHRLSAR